MIVTVDKKSYNKDADWNQAVEADHLLCNLDYDLM